MDGIDLKSLSENLYKVSERYNKKPAGAIRNTSKKLGEDGLKMALKRYGDSFNFGKHYYNLRLKALSGFTFDELCKLRYSSIIMMDESVEEVFRDNPKFHVISKIKNSMWRWGYGSGTWNEIVDAYNGIKAFTLSNNPDFELRLDYTTGYNQFGYSEFSRIFLDGVFAYLVYYKQKHVMTVGFSVIENYGILIQQVQSAQKAGNRYLYKLPTNRVEFVIECFMRHFPSHNIHLIDGGSLTNKTLADYENNLIRVRETLKKEKETSKYRQDYVDECTEYERRIQHLKSDKDRLVSFYNNIGKFKFGQVEYKSHNLSHNIVLLP